MFTNKLKRIQNKNIQIQLLFINGFFAFNAQITGKASTQATITPKKIVNRVANWKMIDKITIVVMFNSAMHK